MRVSAISIRLSARFITANGNADRNNFAPRVGFNYSVCSTTAELSRRLWHLLRPDVLELITLERGLDGRALPVAVRAGNALPGAERACRYFSIKTGILFRARRHLQIRLRDLFCRVRERRASISSITDCKIRWSSNRTSALQWEFARNFVLKVDYLHNFGTHFIIGRNIGVVNNPVVGGPDRVVNLESSVKFVLRRTVVSVEKRFTRDISSRVVTRFRRR